MKRTSVLAVALALAVFGLAACGSDDDSDSDSTAAETTTTEATDTTAAAGGAGGTVDLSAPADGSFAFEPNIFGAASMLVDAISGNFRLWYPVIAVLTLASLAVFRRHYATVLRRPDLLGAQKIYEIYLKESLPMAEPPSELAAATAGSQFARTPENAFLEIVYRSGKKDLLYRGDMASGAIIAAVVGAVLGGILRGFGHWPARSLAGAVGGAVAGFFAIAAAEQSPPGTVEWAVHGSLLGAVFGAPVAVVVAIAAGAIVALVRSKT
jgi:hypothetical protein